MRNFRRLGALTILVVMLVSMFTVSQPAQANHNKTWEYATYGLGALAIYEVVKGKTTAGVLLGGGAAYTYSRARKARRDHQFDEDRYSDDRYYNRYDDRNLDRYQRSRR